MKKDVPGYLKSTVVISFAVGSVVWGLEKLFVSDPPSYIWSVLSFVIAIVFVDLMKGQKVFSRD